MTKTTEYDLLRLIEIFISQEQWKVNEIQKKNSVWSRNGGMRDDIGANDRFLILIMEYYVLKVFSHKEC